MLIVEIKGKQYGIKAGDVVQVDHIDQDIGSEFNDIKVLYRRKSDSEVEVGTPYLEGINVKATIESEFKDKKVKVVHYKPKTRINTTQGHRQQYSRLKIESIS